MNKEDVGKLIFLKNNKIFQKWKNYKIFKKIEKIKKILKNDKIFEKMIKFWKKW